MKKLVYFFSLILLLFLPEILSAQQLPRGIQLPTGEGRAGDRSEEDSNIDQTVLSNEAFKDNTLAVKVMPNPFDTYLRIEWIKESNNPIIRLFDVNGRLIKIWTNKSYNKSEAFQENMIDLSKGIYFLHIQDGKASIYEKLIKS